jgi:hypothetical protein
MSSLNYAGQPIRAGESYGGKPEWTDPECPEVLGGTGGRKRVIKVNQKQRGWGNSYWQKVKASPELYAEHLRKVKEGHARKKAEREAKRKKGYGSSNDA